MTDPPVDHPPTPPPTVRELAGFFLWLGCTAFGGPAAHVAMMEHEVVTRRRWLSREKFLDLLGAANLIPGPNSTEMAMHIGLLAGWTGFVVAGVCFILPAALITGILAWAYVTYEELPAVGGILFGVKPVVVAIVLQALWKFGKDSVKTPLLAIVASGAVAASVCGADELAVLCAGGMVVASVRLLARRRGKGSMSMGMLFCTTPLAALGESMEAFGLWPMFLTFVKIGSVLFGSGYVLLAFLRADFVDRLGWLKEQQLLDAVAVGQVTPGPVFTTATFIGYVLGGPEGAVIATVGIFLPAFFFVAISGPLVPLVRRSRVAGDFLDGVIVASLALMAVVCWELARFTFVEAGKLSTTGMLLAIVLLGLSVFLLLRHRINTTWLILAGAIAGLFARYAIHLDG